jgi:hypothetical protein
MYRMSFKDADMWAQRSAYSQWVCIEGTDEQGYPHQDRSAGQDMNRLKLLCKSRARDWPVTKQRTVRGAEGNDVGCRQIVVGLFRC